MARIKARKKGQKITLEEQLIIAENEVKRLKKEMQQNPKEPVPQKEVDKVANQLLRFRDGIDSVCKIATGVEVSHNLKWDEDCYGSLYPDDIKIVEPARNKAAAHIAKWINTQVIGYGYDVSDMIQDLIYESKEYDALNDELTEIFRKLEKWELENDFDMNEQVITPVLKKGIK